ncbi:hypothetical protein [Vibrio coralliilyticus]|uniref:hypothetical protein n=1 Tax=Vibrio coralliilyticus TaxID=190893 RepID=UPI000C170680|nr:hypothetical protein [Vibrio coralliilyticus]
MNKTDKPLGDLLCYIAKVTMTIRMNSHYNKTSLEQETTPLNVMWLSDMLHNIDGIGNAISNGCPDQIKTEVEKQIGYWKRHQESIETAATNTGFGRQLNVDQGILLLEKIKDAYSGSYEQRSSL